MSVLTVTGPSFNHLERMVAAATANPVANTLYPTTYLYDRLTARPFAFGSIAADSTITWDFNLVGNPGYETSTLDGWTECSVGASNVCTEELALFNSGAKAMKMTIVTTGASNLAGRYKDVTVRAGERLNLSVALRGDGTCTARFKIQNRETGNYLTSAGAWQAAAADVATRLTASYATTALTFSVEAQPSGRPDFATMTLRLTAYIDGSAAGSGYADDILLWPSTDFVFVGGGHNITPGLALQLRRDTAAFAGAGTLEATMAPIQPAFYNSLATIRDDRYWQLLFSGTPIDEIYLGEVVFSQALTLTRAFALPDSREWEDSQARDDSRTYRHAEFAPRILDLTQLFDSSADHDQMLEQVVQRSEYGAHPLILVPVAAEAAVVYGRIEPKYGTDRTLYDGSASFWEGGGIKLREFPITTWVP